MLVPARCCPQAPQNVINVCIPTVYDPSLAPPGKHLVHAYTGVWGGGGGGGGGGAVGRRWRLAALHTICAQGHTM